jgi:hypothetical protein
LLQGQEITIRSDHESLQYFKTMKVQDASLTNKRIVRWSMELADFHFNIEHVKGSENVAGALSRKEDQPEMSRHEQLKSHAEELVGAHHDMGITQTTDPWGVVGGTAR